MKRFRIFEDSVPFSLVIKQSVQESTASEQQLLHWGLRFHIGYRGLGRIQPLEPRNKAWGERPEVTTALWKVEQESRWFGTVSETRGTQHWDTYFGQPRIQRNVCFLGISYQNCWLQWKEKAKNMSVRNSPVQAPSYHYHHPTWIGKHEGKLSWKPDKSATEWCLTPQNPG